MNTASPPPAQWTSAYASISDVAAVAAPIWQGAVSVFKDNAESQVLGAVLSFLLFDLRQVEPELLPE